MDEPIINVRKIIRIGLIAVGVLCVLWFIWFVTQHGGVKITANDNNASVIIMPFDDQRTVAESKGSVYSFLPIGDYIARISLDGKETRRVFSIKAFSVQDISLKLADTTQVSPVTNFFPASFAVSGQNISFFDSERQSLGQVRDTYSDIDSTLVYETAIWSSFGNGYAVARDPKTNERRFIKITDSHVATFSTPAPITTQTYLAFSVSRDGTLFVIQDGLIYSYSNSSYTKLAETSKQATIVGSNNQTLSLFLRSSEDSCEMQFFSITKKSVTKKQPVECIHSPSYDYAVVWSGDNKSVAITQGNSLVITNNSFETSYTIPDQQASNPLWLSNDELVYVAANKVWKYSISKQESTTLGSVPNYITLLSLERDQESQTLYFTGSASDVVSLYKLTSQTPDINAVKLGESNMQTLSDYCQIRYINTSKLVVIGFAAPEYVDFCRKSISQYTASIGLPDIPIEFSLLTDIGQVE
ncbi:hypothetical protein LCH21_02740 [Patescibacteria group bacterium]|nr:hypothetical protein [Patescibacteria group bacterium]